MNPNKQSWALVTGGAIRVGKIIALELAQLGYHIVVHYFHHKVQAEKTVRLAQGYGIDAFSIQADLRSPDEITRMFDEISTRAVPLKVVVNSAATMPTGRLTHVPLSEWQDVMDLNLRAPLLCVREAARIMDAGGIVINIGDEFAGQTWKTHPLYGLTKSTLEHLTRILAEEVKPNIRVAGLALGPVLPPDEFQPVLWDKIVKRSAYQSALPPAVIGQALATLIESEYISGKFLPIHQLIPGD